MKKMLRIIYFAILSSLLLPSVANAISSDQVNVFNNGIYYFNTDVGTSSESSNPCGANQAGNGSIDQLMQAIAENESGGDPTAYNGGGQAYGRYQMIHSTWQDRAKAYDNVAGTNIAGTYPNASDDNKGNIQDAVEYIFLVKESVQFNGSVFKIAVNQYWPVANTDYSQLDIIPAPERRQYGDCAQLC